MAHFHDCRSSICNIKDHCCHNFAPKCMSTPSQVVNVRHEETCELCSCLQGCVPVHSESCPLATGDSTADRLRFQSMYDHSPFASRARVCSCLKKFHSLKLICSCNMSSKHEPASVSDETSHNVLECTCAKQTRNYSCESSRALNPCTARYLVCDAVNNMVCFKSIQREELNSCKVHETEDQGGCSGPPSTSQGMEEAIGFVLENNSENNCKKQSINTQTIRTLDSKETKNNQRNPLRENKFHVEDVSSVSVESNKVRIKEELLRNTHRQSHAKSTPAMDDTKIQRPGHQLKLTSEQERDTDRKKSMREDICSCASPSSASSLNRSDERDYCCISSLDEERKDNVKLKQNPKFTSNLLNTGLPASCNGNFVMKSAADGSNITRNALKQEYSLPIMNSSSCTVQRSNDTTCYTTPEVDKESKQASSMHMYKYKYKYKYKCPCVMHASSAVSTLEAVTQQKSSPLQSMKNCPPTSHDYEIPKQSAKNNIIELVNSKVLSSSTQDIKFVPSNVTLSHGSTLENVNGQFPVEHDCPPGELREDDCLYSDSCQNALPEMCEPKNTLKSEMEPSKPQEICPELLSDLRNGNVNLEFGTSDNPAVRQQDGCEFPPHVQLSCTVCDPHTELQKIHNADACVSFAESRIYMSGAADDHIILNLHYCTEQQHLPNKDTSSLNEDSVGLFIREEEMARNDCHPYMRGTPNSKNSEKISGQENASSNTSQCPDNMCGENEEISKHVPCIRVLEENVVGYDVEEEKCEIVREISKVTEEQELKNNSSLYHDESILDEIDMTCNEGFHNNPSEIVEDLSENNGTCKLANYVGDTQLSSCSMCDGYVVGHSSLQHDCVVKEVERFAGHEMHASTGEESSRRTTRQNNGDSKISPKSDCMIVEAVDVRDKQSQLKITEKFRSRERTSGSDACIQDVEAYEDNQHCTERKINNTKVLDDEEQINICTNNNLFPVNEVVEHACTSTEKSSMLTSRDISCYDGPGVLASTKLPSNSARQSAVQNSMSTHDSCSLVYGGRTVLIKSMMLAGVREETKPNSLDVTDTVDCHDKENVSGAAYVAEALFRRFENVLNKEKIPENVFPENSLTVTEMAAAKNECEISIHGISTVETILEDCGGRTGMVISNIQADIPSAERDGQSQTKSCTSRGRSTSNSSNKSVGSEAEVGRTASKVATVDVTESNSNLSISGEHTQGNVRFSVLTDGVDAVIEQHAFPEQHVTCESLASEDVTNVGDSVNMSVYDLEYKSEHSLLCIDQESTVAVHEITESSGCEGKNNEVSFLRIDCVNFADQDSPVVVDNELADDRSRDSASSYATTKYVKRTYDDSSTSSREEAEPTTKFQFLGDVLVNHPQANTIATPNDDSCALCEDDEPTVVTESTSGHFQSADDEASSPTGATRGDMNNLCQLETRVTSNSQLQADSSKTFPDRSPSNETLRHKQNHSDTPQVECDITSTDCRRSEYLALIEEFKKSFSLDKGETFLSSCKFKGNIVGKISQSHNVNIESSDGNFPSSEERNSSTQVDGGAREQSDTHVSSEYHEVSDRLQEECTVNRSDLHLRYSRLPMHSSQILRKDSKTKSELVCLKNKSLPANCSQTDADHEESKQILHMSCPCAETDTIDYDIISTAGSENTEISYDCYVDAKSSDVFLNTTTSENNLETYIVVSNSSSEIQTELSDLSEVEKKLVRSEGDCYSVLHLNKNVELCRKPCPVLSQSESTVTKGIMKSIEEKEIKNKSNKEQEVDCTSSKKFETAVDTHASCLSRAENAKSSPNKCPLLVMCTEDDDQSAELVAVDNLELCKNKFQCTHSVVITGGNVFKNSHDPSTVNMNTENMPVLGALKNASKVVVDKVLNTNSASNPICTKMPKGSTNQIKAVQISEKTVKINQASNDPPSVSSRQDTNKKDSTPSKIPTEKFKKNVAVVPGGPVNKSTLDLTMSKKPTENKNSQQQGNSKRKRKSFKRAF